MKSIEIQPFLLEINAVALLISMGKLSHIKSTNAGKAFSAIKTNSIKHYKPVAFWKPYFSDIYKHHMCA